MPPSVARSRLLLPGFAAAFLGGATVFGTIWAAAPDLRPARASAAPSYVDKQGDQELAYLLTKLVLKTRAVMAGHYTRGQSAIPGVDLIYKRWIARNAILPAAVAGEVFADVVPGATGQRAWVKMVVEQPRNPDNLGDETALDMLEEMVRGATVVERTSPEATYYGEPIVAKSSCLPCHGDPKGAPDPTFSEYQKDGWKVGEVIGAVIARVAPEK